MATHVADLQGHDADASTVPSLRGAGRCGRRPLRRGAVARERMHQRDMQTMRDRHVECVPPDDRHAVDEYGHRHANTTSGATGRPARRATAEHDLDIGAVRCERHDVGHDRRRPARSIEQRARADQS